jgi:hypothetical protein
MLEGLLSDPATKPGIRLKVFDRLRALKDEIAAEREAMRAGTSIAVASAPPIAVAPQKPPRTEAGRMVQAIQRAKALDAAAEQAERRARRRKPIPAAADAPAAPQQQEMVNSEAEARREVEEAEQAARIEAERIAKLPPAWRITYDGRPIPGAFCDSNGQPVQESELSGYRIVGETAWRV